MSRVFGISDAAYAAKQRFGLHFHHDEGPEGSRGSGAGRQVSTEIQNLVIKLGDDNSNVRMQSVDILVKIAKETPEEIVQRLREALKDPDERVRVNAAFVILLLSRGLSQNKLYKE